MTKQGFSGENAQIKSFKIQYVVFSLTISVLSLLSVFLSGNFSDLIFSARIFALFAFLFASFYSYIKIKPLFAVVFGEIVVFTTGDFLIMFIIQAVIGVFFYLSYVSEKKSDIFRYLLLLLPVCLIFSLFSEILNIFEYLLLCILFLSAFYLLIKINLRRIASRTNPKKTEGYK